MTAEGLSPSMRPSSSRTISALIRAYGWRIVVVSEPFGEHARIVRGHVDLALPGRDVPDDLTGTDVEALAQARVGDEVAGCAGDNHPELRCGLRAGRPAVGSRRAPVLTQQRPSARVRYARGPTAGRRR